MANRCCRVVPGVLLAMAAVLPACDDTPKPAPAPVVNKPPAPPTPPPVRKDPAAVLTEAREAVAKVHALSYAATFTPAGAAEPNHRGEVSATRAEAGGWMLYTKGTGRTPVAEDTPAKDTAFEVGYDGATARSIRAEDSVVFETVLFEWEELASFLASQGAGPIIAHEVFAEAALPGEAPNFTFDGQETLDGEVCDLVSVRPAAGAAGASTQYALAVSDRFPRRIVRGGTGTITLTKVQRDRDVFAAVYALPTPTGYRIRDPGLAAAKQAAGGDTPKGKLLGDPDDRMSASMRPLQIGDAAPAFELKDPSGKAVTLADFKGKVVVLDFWGTWCGWCVKAMPAIEKVHQKYQGKGVAVLGLNTENSADADPAGFMRRNNFTYALLLNAEKITKAYKVFGYPQLYVVGPDGTIVGSEQGFSPDLEDKLSRIIDAALPKN